MSELKYIPPVTHSILIRTPLEKAFETFVEEFSKWWPQEYTWSGSVLETIEIEPEEGGRCYERGPNGFECDWGRVITCDPPELLVFTWQISPNRVPVPNPDKASEVEVRFIEENGGVTNIEFEHRLFEYHGKGAEEYREALASDHGWEYILECYKAQCQNSD